MNGEDKVVTSINDAIEVLLDRIDTIATREGVSDEAMSDYLRRNYGGASAIDLQEMWDEYVQDGDGDPR